MEQINNQDQPIINQPVSQAPNKSAPLKDKTFLIFAIVIGIILLILTAIILVISLSKPKPDTLPTSLIQPTIVPTAMPTIDETADWKTYRDKQYGYEISYPKNVTLALDQLPMIKLVKTYIRAGAKQLINFRINIIPENNPKQLSFESYVKEKYDSGAYQKGNTYTEYYLYPERSVRKEVSGVNAYIEENGFCEPIGCTKIVIPYKQSFIVIIYDKFFGQSPRDQDLFNQILSTFKFLP